MTPTTMPAMEYPTDRLFRFWASFLLPSSHFEEARMLIMRARSPNGQQQQRIVNILSAADRQTNKLLIWEFLSTHLLVV